MNRPPKGVPAPMLINVNWCLLAGARLYGHLKKHSERLMNKTAKISVLSVSILMLSAGAVQLAAAADEHNRPEAREHARVDLHRAGQALTAAVKCSILATTTAATIRHSGR